jgi:hypothetical protein
MIAIVILRVLDQLIALIEQEKLDGGLLATCHGQRCRIVRRLPRDGGVPDSATSGAANPALKGHEQDSPVPWHHHE